MIRPDKASDVRPPNIIAPKQIGETFKPLIPKYLYFIKTTPQSGHQAGPDGFDLHILTLYSFHKYQILITNQ